MSLTSFFADAGKLACNVSGCPVQHHPNNPHPHNMEDKRHHPRICDYPNCGARYPPWQTDSPRCHHPDKFFCKTTGALYYPTGDQPRLHAAYCGWRVSQQ